MDNVHRLPVNLVNLQSVRIAAETFLRLAWCLGSERCHIATLANNKETRLNILITTYTSVSTFCLILFDYVVPSGLARCRCTGTSSQFNLLGTLIRPS